MTSANNTISFTKKDLLDFAQWVYGCEIDTLDEDCQHQCSTHEGALEYWIEYVR